MSRVRRIIWRRRRMGRKRKHYIHRCHIVVTIESLVAATVTKTKGVASLSFLLRFWSKNKHIVIYWYAKVPLQYNDWYMVCVCAAL